MTPPLNFTVPILLRKIGPWHRVLFSSSCTLGDRAKLKDVLNGHFVSELANRRVGS